MARTEEAEAFFHAVYIAVQEIPRGKVTSYGHIAKLVGFPERPRQVGVCLKHLCTDTNAAFNHNNVPWQRVINSKGIISPRSRPSGSQTQGAALQAEGVEVQTGAMGELTVDLEQYGWFPRPEYESSEDDEDVVEEGESERQV